ncbi:sulfurtransferase FdhD, partial [Pseudomonas sp. CrR14]|nr:sulfurtransferase FdhD [Pseudomonas sp. CrR14]
MPRSAEIVTSPETSEPAATQPEGYAYAQLGNPDVTDSAILAQESALAISYNGISHAVMMVSPSAVEDFITGFSLTSAVVDSIDDIYDIRLRHVGAA